MEENVIALIKRILQQWFTNIDNVRESEKHWFNCKTALKTTLESLRKHPQISLKRDDNNKGTSQDFCRWLMNQLLRILGQPSCSEIHEDILKVAEQILADFSAKSNDLLQEVIEDIASCLLETSNIRFDMEENEEYSCQNSLLLFSGRSSVLSGRTNSTICLSTPEKCDAVLSAALHILSLHPYSGPQMGRNQALLGAIGKIIEICEPKLKCAALHVAGDVILETSPPTFDPQLNRVIGLARSLLECEEEPLQTPELTKSTSRLLTIVLRGTEDWDRKANPANNLPWTTVAAILDSASRALASETSLFKKWSVECICFIYSEWDITHHEQLEKQNSSSSIQGYLAETNPLLRTNRTEQLLTLVIRQQTMLGIKEVSKCVLILLDCVPRKYSIEKDLQTCKRQKKISSSSGSPKKKLSDNTPLQLIGVMVRLLENTILVVLDDMSRDSNTRSSNNTSSVETLEVVWRCMVQSAIRKPAWADSVLKKAEDVVATLETVHNDTVYTQCLTILGYTLLLYLKDRQLIPQKIKAVAKKLLDVNINAISDESRTKVLQCYVFLGSYDANNLRYFTDPLNNNPNGKLSVFPLIQLFSQMDKDQITECLKCFSNIENVEIKTEVAKYLDQIILAYLGRPLAYIERSIEADLFECIRYQPVQNGTVNEQLPNQVVEKLLLFLDSFNPPAVIVQALSHVGVLAASVDQNVLLEAVIPLILHEDLCVRTKVANDSWEDVGGLSTSPNQDNRNKFTETQKKILWNLKVASNHNSIEFKKTGIAIAMKLSCRAGFDLCRELIRDIINELVDEEVTIQCYVITGLPTIAASRGLKSTVELFERFKLTICETLTKKILTQHDAAVTFIEEVSGAFFGSKHRFPARYFLARNIQHILPIVFQYGSQTVGHGDVARNVLQTLSLYLDQTVKMMVVKNFPYIFCYIARSSKDLESPFSFVENVSGMTLSELMQCNTQPINNQLVLYLRRDRSAVVWGLSMLEANTTLTRDRKNSESSELPANDTMLAKLIEPKLLGILASLSALQLGRFSEESYLVMESVIELLQIFPSETLGKWKNKFISILRNGLNCPDKPMRHDCLRAWQKFAEISEGKCIGPLLGEIVAVLLPHLDDFPSQVIPTIELLLLQKNRWPQIKEFVGDIGWILIPDHPDLAAVKTFFNQQVRSEHSCEPLTEQTFKNSLRSHITGMTSESGEVRAHALNSLQLILHQNQQIIHEMVLRRETVDSVMTELLSTLLCGVRDSDPDTRILFCTCLGEVGAIDAGLLDSVISTEISKHKVFMHGIEDENFGPELLISLTKGYRNSADQLCEDKFAFAIQAVLSAYRSCGDTLFKKFGERFDESVMEILEPHRNSKYIVKSAKYPEMSSPVYRSESVSSFEDWLTKFTSLLLKIVGEGGNEKLGALLIEPLTIITTSHNETVLFLLPILVLHILLKGCDTAVEFVLTEIQAVLYATQSATVKSDVTKMIAQTVFSLVDYVMIWINKKRGSLPQTRNSGFAEAAALLSRVEKTLNKISKHVIAVAAFNCGAYNRALMYLEYKNKITDQKDWELLQMIYVRMSVFDGVAGVTASRNTAASLKERIQALETAGKLEETPSMYELGTTHHPEDLFFTQGMLKRMIHTGLHTSLLGVVNDKVKESPELTTHLNEYRVQAAWSLARWDVMEEYVASTPDATSWSVGVARLFVSARQLDRQTFGSCVKAMKAEQLIPLSTAVMEGGCYERCYENILNLHLIRDVEEWANSLLFNQTQPLSAADISAKTKEFESRMAVLQDCWRTKEPAFNLHRALLQLVSDHNTQSTVRDTLGSSWIKSATLARKEKLIPCCDNALENANLYSPPNFKIEKASWLWDKDVKEEAMTLLMEYLSEIEKTPAASEGGISRRARAEANLIYAKWREATSYYDSEDIRHLFNKVNEVDSDWEEAQFHLANYYYKWSKAVTTGVKQSMLPHVIKHYGESLKYGSNNIFQSMPRLLTTWFELEGADANHHQSQVSSSQAASKPNMIQLANAHIQDLINKLPTYQWLTALSQILSRICHPSPAVTSKLIEIASLLLYHYPEQAIWQIYSMTNNSNKERVTHSKEIVRLTLLKYKRGAVNGRGIDWFKRFYRDFDKLSHSLLDLSKKDSGTNSTLSISRDFRHVKKMLEDPTFTRIILPIQQNTTVTLPVGSGPHRDHEAFPHHLVTISSIKDEVLVLNSLQKPKKITIVGSNGKTYGLLCKPKDDLRKDCRFMEFNMMVNRLLKKDATARKKQLHIRTYAVVPLSENSGIVEWVDNTKLLRTILQHLYAEYKKGMTKTETKNLFNRLQQIKQAPPSKTRNGKNVEFIELFQNTMLPRHPPVLAEWFRRTFPDPSSWFTARQKYTQTTAVISMVGYVVGLGDRHAENIMFDQTTGETVHVDFDCLFEKGESFDWPEKVPFRLTHNMVDAFGVTGVEGTFRISCVDTMRVMRNERDSLLSVLKTFVHDPLIEWAKQDKRGYQVGVDRGRQNLRTDVSSIMKDKAQEIMKMIEKKLNGQVGKHAAAKLPLSTEGQVHKVIRDSTDVGNLSQMYIGWAPYY